MKILVTGGAGFAGSHFVKYLLKKYPRYKIVNFDKLTYCGNLDNLREIEKNPNYSFIKGDICNLRQVDQVTADIDIIVNFAAETHVDRSILGSRSFILTDILGVQTLLDTVNKHKTRLLIQISTDEVYGSAEKGKFKEADPPRPNSPYAASKAGADLMCRAYSKTYQTPIIITRSCNFYGPNQYPEKVISLFITNLIEGKKVPLYGDGLNRREWIHITDFCEALDFVLHKGKMGEIYNISSGEEKTNLEWTGMVLAAFGKDESWIEFVKDRPGHDRRYALDTTKIEKELGFRPKIKFEQGLTMTINWYRQNGRWWKKLKSGEYEEYYKKQYLKR